MNTQLQPNNFKYRAWSTGSNTVDKTPKMINWERISSSWNLHQFIHPEQYGCILMRNIGISDKQNNEIFEADILHLKLSEELLNTSFSNSKIAEYMNKHNSDEVVFEMKLSDKLCVDYIVRFKRNNTFLKCVDIFYNGVIPDGFTEHEKISTMQIFEEPARDIDFLNYMSDKLQIIGNKFNNPELITP